jgi:hypothetical protein
MNPKTAYSRQNVATIAFISDGFAFSCCLNHCLQKKIIIEK